MKNHEIAYQSSGSVFANQKRVRRLSLALAPMVATTVFMLLSHKSVMAQTCKPAPVGLVSWWPADGNALDSRSRNNGTLTGTTFVAGQSGQGFRFAPNGSLMADGSGSLNIGGDKITIEAWVKLENNVIHPVRDFSGFIGKNDFPTENFALIFESGLIGGIGPGPQLAANEWQVEYIFTNSSGIRVHNQRTNVIVTVDGNYHHFALTYDGSRPPSSNVRIYIDGILQATNITNPADQISGNLKNSPAVPFTISSVGTSNSVSMDEVSAYNLSLTGAEIAAIANAGIAGKCKPTSTVAPSNLVGWWPGDSDARDLSGNSNNGTLNGNSFAVSKVGQGFNFTGLNQRVEVPDSASMDLTGGVTLEAWVAPSQFGEASGGTTFVSKSDLTTLNNQPYGLVYSSSGRVLMRVGNGTAFDETTSTTVLALNTFSQVVGTYDGTTIRIYVNGVLETSKPTSTGALTTNNLPLRIGANNLNGYLGKIDEVSIYSRALTDTEIASIFNAGLAGKLKVATTFPGSTVGTNAGSDATITFQNVSASGTTQQIPLDTGLFALPAGFNHTGLAYDLATAATVSGDIDISFHLPFVDTQSQFSFLKVLHQEGGAFVDRTIAQDFPTRTLTARVPSFSAFVIANGTTPTSVTLNSFTATAFDDGRILLRWQTGFEADNLGFNVYREEAGRRTLINASLIAGSALLGGARTVMSAGQSYVWSDNRSVYAKAHYWLEDVDLNGKSTWHGPFEVQYSKGKSPSLAESELLARIGWRQSLFTFGLGSTPLQRASMPRLSPEPIAFQTYLAKPGVKLTVKREGWYRVTQPELLAAGVDPKADPRLFQMFADGRELSILVTGEQDGRFDPIDSIEFYGVGLDSPFSDSSVYWLVAGNQPGLRIKQVRGEGEASRSTSFTSTVERRDRTIYFAALRNGEHENFFGAVIAQHPVDQTLNLAHIESADSGNAELEVALQGVTVVSHSVNVELNGAPAGVLNFDEQSQGIARFNLPQTVLKEGTNIVRLTRLGGPDDVSLVDHIRISYKHRFRADNDFLKLTATGLQQITVDGFTSEKIRVVDVTDAGSPEEILGAIEKRNAGYAISFAAAAAGERSLIAFTTEQKAASLSLNTGANLRGLNADFVIITRGEFASTLNPLVTLRKSQGLSVVVVDIEDIYDEFSFGQKNPYAVREFLRFAKTNWKKKPRFVLLAGDASLDPKNNLGFGDLDFVPTKLIDTDSMETASDDWMSDFDLDGTADIATGRLPARTAEELSAMVTKIIAYEQSSTSEEVVQVSDANDGFDFEQASAVLGLLIPDSLRITQVNRGRLNPEMARDSLIDAIYRKQFLVNYTGHGSVNQWRGNLLTNDDVLGLRNDHLPLFVMMTCLNGYFQDPALDSIGESLIKAQHGGAIAVWASSGMTLPVDQALMNQELYRQLFSSSRAITIGEAVLRAKASIEDSDIRRTWILLGDPSAKLR